MNNNPVNLILVLATIVLLLFFGNIYPLMNFAQQTDFYSGLTLEFLGSAVFALIVTLVIKRYEINKSRVQEKEAAKYWLGKRLPAALKNNFKRVTSYNYRKPNVKAFYDNIHINSTYDVYLQFQEHIYKYKDLVQDNTVVRSLETIAEEIETAHIDSEKLMTMIMQHSDTINPGPWKFWEHHPEAVMNFYFSRMLKVRTLDYDPRLRGDYDLEKTDTSFKAKLDQFMQKHKKQINLVLNHRKKLKEKIKKLESLVK